MRVAFKPFAAMLSLTVSMAIPAHAEPTNVTVRVMSKDAKFIGTSMGGARITIRDAAKGAVLATGLTAGGTGDTKRIMETSGGNRALLSDDKTAKFDATLDLTQPTLIEIEATGPMGPQQSANRVTSSQWVIPGRHITGGDGWVLEIPGFAVGILSPIANATVTAGKSIDVSVNVAMMCGCPIEPKGLWDANKYEVTAVLSQGGRQISRHALAYAGKTSIFNAAIPVAADGSYDLLVYAYDAANGNTGIARAAFTASK